MVHAARTRMIQDLYTKSPPDGMEELMGTKLLHLFSDIKIEEDFAISVFVLKIILVNKGDAIWNAQ